jgi:transposase
MTIVAANYEFVTGVDTHARTHTYAIIRAATGQTVSSATFPAHSAGIRRATAWMRRHASGPTLVAMEGTSSYGANLTRALLSEGVDVREVSPPVRNARAMRGKSDEIDAISAARTAIGMELEALARPRADGIRSALRVLLVARRSMDTYRTANRNALNALLRSFDLDIDARHTVTDAQVITISNWRARPSDDAVTATIRAEAHRLAASILTLTNQLEANHAALAAHVDELAPGFRRTPGVGPVTGAIILAAYSHHGRLRSEAAFAQLAGVAPLQASSGNTTRHRLNRRGDRQLNCALDIIAHTRMSYDARTQEYVLRRKTEGRSQREIRRSLKRYIARQIFRQLNSIMS